MTNYTTLRPVCQGRNFNLAWLSAEDTGSYPLVAILGGAVWVGCLSLIVSMPLVIARVKKQLK